MRSSVFRVGPFMALLCITLFAGLAVSGPGTQAPGILYSLGHAYLSDGAPPTGDTLELYAANQSAVPFSTAVSTAVSGHTNAPAIAILSTTAVPTAVSGNSLPSIQAPPLAYPILISTTRDGAATGFAYSYSRNLFDISLGGTLTGNAYSTSAGYGELHRVGADAGAIQYTLWSKINKCGVTVTSTYARAPAVLQ